MESFFDEVNQCKAKGLFLYFHLYVALKRLKIDWNRLEDLTINESHAHVWNLARVGCMESDFKGLMQGS